MTVGVDQARVAGYRVVDLTQPLSPRTPRSSDHRPVEFESVRWYSRHGLRTSNVLMNVHVGTHVDAPALYYSAGKTIDEVPLHMLCGAAVVIDASLGQWGKIGPAELESSPEPVREGDIVILRTGWHHHYWDEETYVLKGPGLTRAGVDWLADRNIRLVGADLPSPEHIFMRSRQWRDLRPDLFGGVEIDPEEFPPHYAHQTFLKRDICLLEGLGGDIDELVGKRVELLALPLKFAGVEAAQCRVVALVPDEAEPAHG